MDTSLLSLRPSLHSEVEAAHFQSTPGPGLPVAAHLQQASHVLPEHPGLQGCCPHTQSTPTIRASCSHCRETNWKPLFVGAAVPSFPIAVSEAQGLCLLRGSVPGTDFYGDTTTIVSRSTPNFHMQDLTPGFHCVPDFGDDAHLHRGLHTFTCCFLGPSTLLHSRGLGYLGWFQVGEKNRFLSWKHSSVVQ